MAASAAAEHTPKSSVPCTPPQPPSSPMRTGDRVRGPDHLGVQMTTATMDALIVHAPNRYSIEQAAMPSPQPYEALCRVRAVAICGTAPNIISDDFPGF